MSAEFVDTNVLVYAHDGGAGRKHEQALNLLRRLFSEGAGAVSIQIFTEFYSVAIRKLAMTSEEAEIVIADLGGWILHRPTHADLLAAAQLHRRYQVAWWDALVIQSATRLGCATLWSEDLGDGHRYGSVTVRNPFA
jgi:predicted nucleic acid-binding protein